MRACVASDDPSLSYQLREALTRLGHDCSSSRVVSLAGARRLLPAAAGSASTDAIAPDLIFVVLSPDPEAALSAVRELRGSPATLLAVGPATDPKLLLRTIREGAREYLDEANLASELAAALERLKQEGAGQRTRARTIALLAASGGCGCSTLAAGIAAALAKANATCILLDLDIEAGDLSPLLDLRPTYSLPDLCRGIGRLDRGLLEGALVRHDSGVMLLAAPARIADVEYVTADGVQRVLSLSRELAEFVIADLGRDYRTETMQVLAEADEILLILRLDFTSLRNARRLIEFLQENGRSTEHLHLVVNRYRQAGELPLAQAESALGMTIAKFVNDDPKAVMRANNNGIPVVLESPSAKVSTQISELAAMLRSRV